MAAYSFDWGGMVPDQPNISDNGSRGPAATAYSDYPPKVGKPPSWWSEHGRGVAWGYKAGADAYSKYHELQSSKNMLGYEAQVAGNQAAIYGYQAQLAQQQGAAQEQGSRLQTAQQFGAQRAHMAASGIDLGQGSATDVLASTAYMGERNAAMIRDDTNRQVWNYRNQQAASLYQQQARLAQRDAINPEMAAFTSLLGSGLSYAAAAYGG